MRKTSAAGVLAVLFALSLIGLLASNIHAQGAAKREVQKWEYKVIHAENHYVTDELTHAGEAGWEGFNVVDIQNGKSAFIYLKRPKQ